MFVRSLNGLHVKWMDSEVIFTNMIFRSSFLSFDASIYPSVYHANLELSIYLERATNRGSLSFSWNILIFLIAHHRLLLLYLLLISHNN